MSRVYDALQRSQGENQDVSPGTPASQPARTHPESAIREAEAAHVDSMPTMNFAVESTPLESIPSVVEGSVGSGNLPFETPSVRSIPESYQSAEAYRGESIPPEVRPSAALRTEALQSSAIATATAANHWLNVPSERILRPNPTPEQRLVTLADPNSPGAEMFRVLSTRLAHMQNKRPLRKLLITSSEGDEGKSVVSANLALVLAKRAGERTLLIEADLRRPSSAALFTSSPLKGIAEWVEGKLDLEDILCQISGLPLWFLPAGRPVDEPHPLLESERFAELLQTLSVAFDWVVIDATPMLPMADATSLSRLSDGVLVVVREGHTRRKVLNKALETIEPGKLLGMVLNEASMLQVGYDRYYEGYGRYGKSSKRSTSDESDRVKVATA